jgi:hypothetical protein
MSYSIWLKNLTDHFFDNHMSEQRVRLMIDDEILDKEFKGIGGKDDFVKSMHDGPEWIKALDQDLYETCRFLHRQWKTPALRPEGYPEIPNDGPPFLPYLCLFAYLWTVDSDFHAHDFHKRLEMFYPNHGFDKNQNMKWCTETLWQGLADWSAERDKKNLFKIERLGKRKHVDISRAQILFRPRELKLLPDIFSSCGLQPEDASDLNNIHEALILKKHSWHYKLPVALSNLISDWDNSGDPMGESVLRILSEELTNWDGEFESSSKYYTPSIKILRSIRADTGRLSVDLCVSWENVSKLSNLELNVEGETIGRFSSESALIAILKQESNKWDPYFVGPPKTGSVYSEDDDFGDENHSCKWFPRAISLFQQRLPPNGRLIETDIPPRSGDCICLVAEVGKKSFNAWKKDHESSVTKLEITCPPEWEIYRLSKIESLDMDSFPLDRRASSVASIIKLTAGTRIAPDKYMDFDLPIISSTVSGITLDCAGAELKEVQERGGQSQAWRMPEYKQYALSNYDGNGTILISAQEELGCQEVRELSIIKSSELPGDLRSNDSAFYIDRFGWPAAEGLRGTILPSGCVPQNGKEHEFYDMQDDKNFFSNRIDPKEIHKDKFRFVEVLGCKGKYSYSDLKGKMLSLCDISEGDFFRALRLMRDLGDIDICTEDNGIISHIYPNKAQLVMMPWKADDKIVAALRGTYTLTAFKSYLKKAAEEGEEVFSLNEPNDLENIIPPTTYFTFNTTEACVSFSQSCRLQFCSRGPASRQLAGWSGNSDEWFSMLESSNTTQATGKIEKYYDTHSFTFRNWQEENKRHRYELFLISRRIGHFKAPPVINFRKSDLINDSNWEIQLDANIREPAWPKWYLQNILTGPKVGSEMTYKKCRKSKPEEVEGLLPIFHKYRMKQLLLPRELTLPYVLSRALTLCSALPPVRIPAEGTTYSDVVGNFTAKEKGKGYKGELWLYSAVSYELAELILSKVDAFPAFRKYLGFVNENGEYHRF